MEEERGRIFEEYCLEIDERLESFFGRGQGVELTSREADEPGVRIDFGLMGVYSSSG